MATKTMAKATSRALKAYRRQLAECDRSITVCERHITLAENAKIAGRPGTRAYENAAAAINARHVTWQRRLESAIDWRMSINHKIECAEAEAAGGDKQYS